MRRTVQVESSLTLLLSSTRPPWALTWRLSSLELRLSCAGPHWYRRNRSASPTVSDRALTFSPTALMYRRGSAEDRQRCDCKSSPHEVSPVGQECEPALVFVEGPPLGRSRRVSLDQHHVPVSLGRHVQSSLRYQDYARTLTQQRGSASRNAWTADRLGTAQDHTTRHRQEADSPRVRLHNFGGHQIA